MLKESTKPWYDQPRHILHVLANLSEFDRLVRERRAAGYVRKETLTEFIVFGLYWLDSCGNCGRIKSDGPSTHTPTTPALLTKQQFWATFPEASISVALTGRAYATPGQQCVVCGLTWSMDNAHDMVQESNTHVYPLAMFRGQSLTNVIEHFEARTDAEYGRVREAVIRHDRFIDLTPKYPGTAEDWQRHIVKNERGWMSEADLGLGYIVQGDEEISFYVWRTRHPACAAFEREQQTLRHARDVFDQAYLHALTLKATPNGYCPCDVCPPWVQVTTEVGTFTLGRRKRVWHLGYETIDPSDRFPKWPHTHGKGYIHAYTDADLHNALKTFAPQP